MDRTTEPRISRELRRATSALIALSHALDDRDWPAVLNFAGQLKLHTTILNADVQDGTARAEFALAHRSRTSQPTDG